MNTFFQRLLGRWRLAWGFCPACNSDAPEKQNCIVCCDAAAFCGFESSFTGKETKALWWERFTHFLEWEYGECLCEYARRNRKTGEVQHFVFDAGLRAYDSLDWFPFTRNDWDKFHRDGLNENESQ